MKENCIGHRIFKLQAARDDQQRRLDRAIKPHLDRLSEFVYAHAQAYAEAGELKFTKGSLSTAMRATHIRELSTFQLRDECLGIERVTNEQTGKLICYRTNFLFKFLWGRPGSWSEATAELRISVTDEKDMIEHELARLCEMLPRSQEANARIRKVIKQELAKIEAKLKGVSR